MLFKTMLFYHTDFQKLIQGSQESTKSIIIKFLSSSNYHTIIFVWHTKNTLIRTHTTFTYVRTKLSNTHHLYRTILSHKIMPSAKKGEYTGPIISPILAQSGPPALDGTSPAGHIKQSTIKNILFNASTVILLSDSFIYGIRSYNEKRLALRWYIPPDLYVSFTLNLIELL